jgi:dienelactone hydrolase
LTGKHVSSFGGEVLLVEVILDQSRWSELDLPDFLKRNNKDTRTSQIFECAQLLRSKHHRTGAIGFCFGGWGVFRLGAQGNNLVDCISTAHPTDLTREEIKNVAVPVQIVAPEFDPQFTEDLKAFSTQTIPTLGVPFDYQFFPGLEHAFAVRGDPRNLAERKGMERAKNAAVLWFRQWLHES